MIISGEAVLIQRGEDQGPPGEDGQTTVIRGTWIPSGGAQAFPAEVTIKYSGLNTPDELQVGTDYSITVEEV